MKVFISYRRSDLSGHAQILVGRMRDRLAQQFGAAGVFMDIDSIPYGEDFVECISGQVGQADVVIAVIGPQWAQEMAARAETEDDFVRIEIEAALGRGIRVIPVLAGGASMPGAAGLPPSVQPLRRRNALAVDSGRDFHVHMERLIKALEAAPAKLVPEEPAALPVSRQNPLVNSLGMEEFDFYEAKRKELMDYIAANPGATAKTIFKKIYGREYVPETDAKSWRAFLEILLDEDGKKD